MPAQLTPEQRILYGALLAQGDLSGAGAPLDSGAFARKMLQPGYVEMVRKHITGRPGRDSADSAGFYENYRTPVVNVDLANEDLTPPKITISREGTYDTLRFPALGDIPAHTRVEFRPSVNQRIGDKFKDVQSFGSRLLQTIQELPPPVDTGFGAKLLEGLIPTNKLERLLTPRDTLDAISGAAARPKHTPNTSTLDAISGAAAKPKR